MDRIGGKPMFQHARHVAWALWLAGSAAAASLEGVYTYGAREAVTIRVVRGKEEGTFQGTVIAAGDDWHRPQINQVVLELRRVGDNAYRGRCSAYHMRASDNVVAVLEVAEAGLLPNGNLRCLLKIPDEGSVQIVYERAAGAEPPRPEPGDAAELVGTWADSTGAIIVFQRDGEDYVGQVVRQAADGQEPGPRLLAETIRVKRVAPDCFKGTAETRAGEDEKPVTQEAELLLRGGTLTILRPAPNGAKHATTARRVPTYDESADREPKATERDPGELCGVWRAPNGDTTRYARQGSRYTGYVVAIAPDKRGFGFRIGEEGVRLTRLLGGAYVGKVLVKTEGGKDSWWEDIEFVVSGDSLRYVRYMVNGKLERGGSSRVVGLQGPAPRSP